MELRTFIARALAQGLARPRYAFGSEVQPVAADFGVGKWSRVMTFGPKRQQQGDGSMKDFDFTPETFGQVLRNFGTRFTQRRLGSDWEHQAKNAPLNGLPAPNVVLWDALCVIQSEQVTAIEEQKPGPPPVPAELRAWLAEEFPKADPDPSGLWARCSEVLMPELVKKCRQLSPLFDDEAKDEVGNPIGYALGNISFVNFAFQDGTVFHFSGLPAGQQHTPGGGSMDPKEMMSKLKLGDDATPEMMAGALTSYMAETMDPPEMRGKMKACMEGVMKARMAATPPGGEQPPPVIDKDKPPAPPPAMAADPEKEATMKSMSAMSARLSTAEARVQQMEQREADARARTAAETFADGAIGEGRQPSETRENLIAMHTASPQNAMGYVQKFKPGTFERPRMFPGGSPAGVSPGAARATGGAWTMSGGTPMRGIGLSGMANKIAAERKLPYDQALLAAAAENPTLY